MDKNIEKTFISFETAKLLKKAGFNDICSVYFNDGTSLDSFQVLDEDTYPKCTQHYVVDWFRIRKGVFVNASPIFRYNDEPSWKVEWRSESYRNAKESVENGALFFKNGYKPSFSSYEEALENAIQNACKLIIE